jgi:DnaK suppressor protein
MGVRRDGDAVGDAMNTSDYKQRLLALEKVLSARTERKLDRARDHETPSVADVGDASVADETASEDFTEAELDSTLLTQVRDALRRIEDGTFGKCLVDGGPIDATRLQASPWAPYCLKHQRLLEAGARRATPTL